MIDELRVLFIKKDDYAIQLIKIIRSFGYHVKPGYFEPDHMNQLHNNFWDILVINNFGTSSELNEMIMMLSQLDVTIPWIIISKKIEKDVALFALDSGCRDFISIHEVERLELVIYRLLIESEQKNKNRVMQEKLIAEKEELTLTLSSIGDGVITVDNNERIVMMSSGSEAITGWSSDLAMNKPIYEVFSVIEKNTGRLLDYLVHSSVNNGEVVGLKKDTVLLTKNGDEKYVSACISPIKVIEKIIGAIIVFRDITRIRLTEKKLLSEQENMNLIFDTAPIGMLLIDENEMIKKANKSLLHIISRTEQEVISQKIGAGLGCISSYQDMNACGFSNLCGKCELRRTVDEIYKSRKAILGKEVYYTTIANGFEKNLFLKINSVPIMVDEKKYVMLVIDDITERKTAEEGLRRYQLLSNSANDIIMFADVDGRIIEANNAALTAYGYTGEEILSKSIFRLINPDKRTLIRTQSYKVNREGVYYEATAKRKDGSYFYVEVSLQGTEISGKKFLLSIQRDISERKQTQIELELARKQAESANLAKSEFLANMSHEIRTPLNGMLGMIDLTLLTGLADEQKENLMIAKDCASTLLNLINDILDFSRIEAKKLSLEKISFDLQELVEKTVKPHYLKAQEKGIKLYSEFNYHLIQFVNGDPNRLKQVINNLLGNAVKFTEQGEISIISNLLNHSDNMIELEFKISDTGIGIDPNAIDGIFDTFSQADSSVTRKFGGSGLGLAITRQLVEMMDGRIWVESIKGKGSTFFFTIKLSTGKVISSEKNSVEMIHRAKRPLRILLAEDDKINRVVITQMIRGAGHFIEAVNNGYDALQALEEEEFDVVLMDIQMPEMDGIEAVRRIRKNEEITGKYIPILALTANALQGDREKYLSVGMDDYISKPVNINNLLETIDKASEISKEKKSIDRIWIKKSYFDLAAEYSKNEKQMIDSIYENIEFLKDAFKKEDITLVENFAHVIKRLSSAASALALKSAIFKVELAARREDMAAASQHFYQVVEEFDKLKNQVANSKLRMKGEK